MNCRTPGSQTQMCSPCGTKRLSFPKGDTEGAHPWEVVGSQGLMYMRPTKALGLLRATDQIPPLLFTDYVHLGKLLNPSDFPFSYLLNKNNKI